MTTHRTTALITGASMGIGLELARTFAKNGHALLLVARSEDKLRAAAAELSAAHGVPVDVVARDLGDPNAPADIERVVTEKGLTIDYIVNNAGFGTTGPFVRADLARELEQIRVNVLALTELTHRFGKGLFDRKRGGILNIASTAGFQPGPGMATYYATKAYVVSFTEALAEEFRGTSVHVTAFCPGPVATEFSRTAGNAESMLFRMSPPAKPDVVARDAYRALMRGNVVHVFGFMNWLGVQMLRISPRSVVRRLVAWLNAT